MSGFEELKDAYNKLKYGFSYICSGVTMEKDDDDVFYNLTFEYQGSPERTSFSYGFPNSMCSENDEIDFTNEDYFSVTRFFAITDFIKTINKNRLDTEAMDAFIQYLITEKK